MRYRSVCCSISEQPLEFKMGNDGLLVKLIKFIHNCSCQPYDKLKGMKAERSHNYRHIFLEEDIYKNGKWIPYQSKSPEYVKENIANVIKDLVEEYKIPLQYGMIIVRNNIQILKNTILKIHL